MVWGRQSFSQIRPDDVDGAWAGFRPDHNGGVKVLLVEDDPAVRDIADGLLRDITALTDEVRAHEPA